MRKNRERMRGQRFLKVYDGVRSLDLPFAAKEVVSVMLDVWERETPDDMASVQISQARLAERAGLSLSAVAKAMALLKQRGLIEITNNHGRHQGGAAGFYDLTGLLAEVFGIDLSEQVDTMPDSIPVEDFLPWQDRWTPLGDPESDWENAFRSITWPLRPDEAQIDLSGLPFAEWCSVPPALRGAVLTASRRYAEVASGPEYKEGRRYRLVNFIQNGWASVRDDGAFRWLKP